MVKYTVYIGQPQWRSGSGSQSWAISFSTIYVGVFGNTETKCSGAGYRDYLPRVGSLTVSAINVVCRWEDAESSPTDAGLNAYRIGIGK